MQSLIQPIKQILSLFFLVCALSVQAQDVIEWSPDYIVEIGDFQSPASEINESLTSYAFISGSQMNFAYRMSSGQFAFTKNFNQYVSAVFDRSAAVIAAPDRHTAHSMAALGQYCFDLAELYARKFRKRLYDEKGAFSSSDFFMPIHEELQREMSALQTQIMTKSDFGRKSEMLENERQKVLLEIEELAEYCKSCKPAKKKKRKKNRSSN